MHYPVALIACYTILFVVVNVLFFLKVSAGSMRMLWLPVLLCLIYIAVLLYGLYADEVLAVVFAGLGLLIQACALIGRLIYDSGKGKDRNGANTTK